MQQFRHAGARDFHERQSVSKKLNRVEAGLPSTGRWRAAAAQNGSWSRRSLRASASAQRLIRLRLSGGGGTEDGEHFPVAIELVEDFRLLLGDGRAVGENRALEALEDGVWRFERKLAGCFCSRRCRSRAFFGIMLRRPRHCVCQSRRKGGEGKKRGHNERRSRGRCRRSAVGGRRSAVEGSGGCGEVFSIALPEHADGSIGAAAPALRLTSGRPATSRPSMSSSHAVLRGLRRRGRGWAGRWRS